MTRTANSSVIMFSSRALMTGPHILALLMNSTEAGNLLQFKEPVLEIQKSMTEQIS